MRLGLIGGTDSKRTSGVYQPQDVVALQDAKKYTNRYAYDEVFNALSSAGVAEGFCFSPDGTKLYTASRGTRTTAKIAQYNLSTPYEVSTLSYQSGKDLVVGDIEPACNSVAISSDGTRLYFAGYSNDAIWSCTLATPFDLGTASIDAKAAYIGGQDASPATAFFGDNGTKMYVLGQNSGFVYQYTLSTAWSLNTATYASKSLNINTLSVQPQGIFIGNNGTKLYVTNNTGDYVASFTLSTAWDISTGTADYSPKAYSVATQITLTTALSSIFIGNNGSTMYALSGDSATTDTIFQYSLGTAWNISTATYASKSFSVNTQETTSKGLFFRADGTSMYVVGGTNKTIYQYTLSTAWDVATASYASKSFSVATQFTTAPTGLFFSSDGTRLYVTGTASQAVSQYSLSTAWDIATASFVRTSATVGNTAPEDVFFRDDGTKMYIAGNTGDEIREFTLSTAWDVSTISFRRIYPVAYLTSAPVGIFFKTDGTELYVAGQNTQNITQLSLGVAWDSASVKGRFYVGAEETVPTGIYLKSDGLKMYVTGQTGDDVNEYDLSTAWDISTAVYLRVSATHGEGTATSIWFKDDGTKMYIVGSTNDAVREFTLSTAWNVSTITFSKQQSFGFDTAPLGVTFKNDGTRIYVSGSVNNVVYELPLGTAWDVGSAKNFFYIGGTETTIRGMTLSPDGSTIYTSGNGSTALVKWSLSTPYAIETASLAQSATLGAGLYGHYITPDGLTIYTTFSSSSGLLPSGGRQVRKFNLTSPFNLSTSTLAASPDLLALFGLTGASSSPWSVALSPDGTHMFVLSDVTQGMYQFSLRFA